MPLHGRPHSSLRVATAVAMSSREASNYIVIVIPRWRRLGSTKLSCMRSPEELDIMSLRDHLLAAQAGQNAPTSSSPTSPHDLRITHSPAQQHIDPAIGGGPTYAIPVDEDSIEDQMNDSRKGRRELSTSKRAAQNRAAQRAFRQRKEHYIQTLKDQVKEHQILTDSYTTIQKENFQLRQYIITLQARLLESHTELPPPPDSVDLSRPLSVVEPRAPTAAMSSSAINDLQAAAAAAAEASEGAHSYRHHDESKSSVEPAMDVSGGEGGESSGGA